MSKVLLVNFPFKATGIPTIMPIQLASLGSYLADHGHTIKAIDLNVRPEKDLFQTVGSEDFDAVGISYRNVLPLYWLERFRSLRRMILKLSNIGIKPLLGGTAFSLFYPKIFQWIPEVDLGVIGEGEYTIHRMAEKDDFEDIPGLCFRTGAGLKVNDPPRFLEEEEIPSFRELDGFDYADPSYLVGLQTYRGCNFSCAYCPVNRMGGKTTRLRRMASVKEDLVFLKARGIEHIFIIDGVFNHPWDRSLQILQLFRGLRYPRSWEGFLKPFPEVEEGHIREMAATGAVRFHVDVIAGTERLTSMVGHQVEIGHALRIAGLLRKEGIEGVFYFAYQLPGERLKDEIETLKTMGKIRRRGQKTFIYPFFPYPGTGFERYYGKILDKGILWHILRLVKMVSRPSFFQFKKNLKSLTEMTGKKH
ncbi:B12-binding domain-containing radical SAM protein [Thermodesulfobacteriota bacterium]